MAIVSKGSIGILAQVVEVASIKVSRLDRSFLIVVDKLEDREMIGILRAIDVKTEIRYYYKACVMYYVLAQVS